MATVTDGVKLGCGAFILLPLLIVGGLLALVLGLALCNPTVPSTSYTSSSSRTSSDTTRQGITLNAPAKVSAWSVYQGINELDDSPIVTLRTEAKERSTWPYDPAALILRCKENRTDMYINWGGDFIDNEGHYVTIRIGSAQPSTRQWDESTNYEASFYRGSPISLIKRMFGETKFIANVTPYGESPRTVTFNIEGLEDDIMPLRTACHW